MPTVKVFYKFTITISLLALLFACSRGQTDTDKAIPKYVICIETGYNSSPEWIEELITLPLEKECQLIEGLAEIKSQSTSSRSLLMLSFNWEINQHKALRDVKDATERAIAHKEFPKDMETPPFVYAMDESYWPSLSVLVSHNAANVHDFENYISQLEGELNHLNEVADIRVEGLSERYVEIDLNEAKLNKVHTNPQQVAENLSSYWIYGMSLLNWEVPTKDTRRIKISANEHLGISSIKQGGNRIRMEVSTYPSREELNQSILFTNKENELFFLGDVAESINFKGEVQPPYTATLTIHKRVDESLEDLRSKVEQILQKSQYALKGVQHEVRVLPFDTSSHDLFSILDEKEEVSEVEMTMDRDEIRKLGLSVQAVQIEFSNLINVYPELTLEAIIKQKIRVKNNHGELLNIPLSRVIKIESLP